MVQMQRLFQLLFLPHFIAQASGTLGAQSKGYAHHMTSQELQAVLANKASTNTLKPRNDMYPINVNTKGICVSHDGYKDGVPVKYVWIKAECDTETGNPRMYKVTCSEQFPVRGTQFMTRFGDNREFRDECPIRTICQTWIQRKDHADKGLKIDIECVPISNVVVDSVHSEASAVHPDSESVFCHDTISLPDSDSDDSVTSPYRPFSMVLTEQTFYPNGSRYKAPILFIRDKTTSFDYDRVLTRDASVASAQINFFPYHGKLQRRKFEFCMQMQAHHPGSWVIFMFSWFKINQQQHRVPAQIDQA